MSISMKAARAGNVRAMPGTGYQGDPGIFGFLGKAFKGGLGLISRAGIPGVSALAGVAGGVLGAKTQKAGQRESMRILSQPLGFAGQPMPAFTRPQRPAPGIRAAGQRFFPGGATGMIEGGPPGPGYHLNKSNYFLLDGTFVPAGSRWVKNRRRNPLNPRALDRAIGRLGSAKKATKKLGRITIRSACPA